MSFDIEVTKVLTDLLSIVLTASIAAVTPGIKKFIAEKANSKVAVAASDAIDGLAKIAEAVVTDFNQRVVADTKEEGKWSPQWAQQVKREAIAAVNKHGVSFIPLLEKTMGDVEPLIATLIEQAVAKLKVQINNK